MTGYVVSPLARRDLDEIWSFTAGHWSDRQAELYLREIQKTIELAAKNPKLGRACNEIREGYFKLGVGSHILFYRHKADKIEIVRILHGAMDIGQHL